MEILGFNISRKPPIETSSKIKEETPDGATVINGSGHNVFGVSFDAEYNDNTELINLYRQMAQDGYVDGAIDDIVNEAIVQEQAINSTTLDLELTEFSDNIKSTIQDEYSEVLRLLKFKNNGNSLFRKWYVDGILYAYKKVNKVKPDGTPAAKSGLDAIKILDPRDIKFIREEPLQTNGEQGPIEEYFLYTDTSLKTSSEAIKIKPDAMTRIISGMVDDKNRVLSFLHAAIKPWNQLTSLEDSVVVYRMVRAPERRIFFIDVGELPKTAAEEYMKNIINKHQNKMVYDASTGKMKENTNMRSMLEDIWLPRRDGCLFFGTKINMLYGEPKTLGTLIEEFDAGIENWTYSINTKTGAIVPGLISWAGPTRKDAEVLDVYLDNGEIITATLDHKFILRTGEKIEAENLVAGSSLMPFDYNYEDNTFFDLEKEDWISGKTLYKYNFTYRTKWSPGLDNFQKAGTVATIKQGIKRQTNRIKSLKQIPLLDIIEIVKIHTLENKFVTNAEIMRTIQRRFPELDKSAFQIYLAEVCGYNTLSDLIVRNVDQENISKTRRNRSMQQTNHKVLKIVHRSDRIDVGTLTIDEDHIHHDYHNFALASGVFVMNSRGTEVDTLQAGQNLGEIDDVLYFKKRLFNSLKIPVTRTDQDNTSSVFSLARSGEITRDEIKFHKHINKLRNLFGCLLTDILKTQLILKKIITVDEWSQEFENLNVIFNSDSHFAELKAAELFTNRLDNLSAADEFVGRYFSEAQLKKEILKQTEDEIEEIQKQIKAEGSDQPDENG